MLSNQIISNTVIASDRLFSLYDKLKEIENISGNIVEIGVYKGGSARLICENAGNAKVFLIDTFKGLPKESINDNYHKEGDFSDTSLDHVKQVLDGLSNYTFIIGNFPKETNNKTLLKQKFKFCHIDVDLYEGYIDCLNFFYPKMVSGGYIIFDDYCASSCLGAKKAVDEFITENKLELKIGNGHAFIKI